MIVAPGTYLENIDFKGKGITVKSASGAAQTVIDGSAPMHPDHGSVVIFSTGETASSRLEGFTLRGGTGTLFPSGLYLGGGIHCEGTSPVIIDNVIRENSALAGGGVACQAASPRIEGNRIEDNTADEGGGLSLIANSTPLIKDNVIQSNAAPVYSGGGIECVYSSPRIEGNLIRGNQGYCGAGIVEGCGAPEIVNNVIEENVTLTTGGGVYLGTSLALMEGNQIRKNRSVYASAGIHIVGPSSPIIRSNEITDNIVSDNDGGGIGCYQNCTPVIECNRIMHNEANKYGGGIFIGFAADPSIRNNMLFVNRAKWGAGICCYQDSSPLIVNTTFHGNVAIKRGGAIKCLLDSTPTIVDSILWGNVAPEGPEISASNATLPLHLRHVILEGGPGAVHLTLSATVNYGPCILDENPRFVDGPNGDFHLERYSPCINRGEGKSGVTYDLEGKPRPYMGSVDLGADEFWGTHFFETYDFTLSESLGGTILFSLLTDPVQAGRTYFVLGSMTGNAPGIPLTGGLFLPIQWDLFTNLGIRLLNTPCFKDFYGVLNGSGVSMAKFDTLGPLPPGCAGMTLHFAYLLADPVDLVSNPLVIEIIP